jgi:hypothetical protein
MLAEALQGKVAFPRHDEMHPVRHRRQLPLGFTIDGF